jgi:hypothetical protein
VLSVGKIMGILYATMGLLVVPFFLLVSAMGALSGERQAGFGLAFAIMFTIFIPIMYGVLGFVGGVIIAFLYNLVAERLGGIEIEFELPPMPQIPQPQIPLPPSSPPPMPSPT